MESERWCYTVGGKNSYESIKRYEDKTYDKMLVRVPKGTKDRWKGAAQTAGESLNSYIVGAVEDRISKDGTE